MKHNNIFAALLLAATAISLTACSEKESNNDTTDPQPRVVRIYTARHTLAEMYNAAADTWVTVTESTHERDLLYELFYTGDRLDSLIQHAQPHFYVDSFSYDDQGRLAATNSNWSNGVFYFYDADGRLSRTYNYSTEQDDTVSRAVVDYIWDGDRLMRAELERTSHYDAINVSEHVTHIYTWSGDNVATIDCYTLNRVSGTRDTVNYAFEYTSAPNPLYGLTYWMNAASGGIIWSSDAIDGICRNIPSHITANNGEYTYDVTTSGGLTTSYTVHQVNDNPEATPRIRITSEETTDLEYEK